MPNIIWMGVPAPIAPAIAKQIADFLEQEDAATPGGVGPGAVEARADDLMNGWTEQALRQHYRDSSQKMRAFLVYLAEHADKEVTTHAAAQAVGSKDWNSIAGMLGAAQRRAKNHFGRESGPWSRRWAADDQARLRMPARVAQVVLSEAEAQGDRKKESQAGQ